LESRDLEAILSHYAEEIELRSPIAAHILGDPSGTVVGKQNLGQYIQKIVTIAPGDLGLELLGVYEGVASLIAHFKGTAGTAAELMELNAQSKVRRAVAHFRTRDVARVIGMMSAVPAIRPGWSVPALAGDPPVSAS
jgi:hypothetical protein